MKPRRNASMENAKCYAPQILVGTEGLPREQWLEYRRKGIGGSDAAAVLGISPFRTGRDLYYDKLNIVTADDAENWVQLEVGTLLEPLVAKIFAHKTGYKIYRRPFMFRHPQYPWMLADLDYMVELPDGTTAILEIKTTNYNAKDNWWYNGEEIVPIYYESQGRHYMAVMNIDRVYFCCLYGNSEDEAIIRRIDRDMAYEEELIALERDFWENHVLTKTPPPYVEADGDLILESLRRKLGPADKDAPPVLLGQPQFVLPLSNVGLSIRVADEFPLRPDTCNRNSSSNIFSFHTKQSGYTMISFTKASITSSGMLCVEKLKSCSNPYFRT